MSDVRSLEDDALIAAMPASARKLADEIGLQAALEVMLLYGGARLYVPTMIDGGAGERLVGLLGRPAVEQLIASRGGVQFDVPNLGSLERLIQAQLLSADRDAGMTLRQLAGKHRVVERTVRRRLRAFPP